MKVRGFFILRLFAFLYRPKQCKIKKILILVFLCGGINLVMAQNGAFGPRVSLLSNELSLSDNFNNAQSGDAEFGYHFGVFSRIGLGKSFMLMPELLFSDTQATISITRKQI